MARRRPGLIAALFLLTAAPSALAQAPPTAAVPAKLSPAAQAEIDTILAADMDAYLALVRKKSAADQTLVNALAIAADSLAAGKPDDAQAAVGALSGRRRIAATDLLDMWIALARDDKPEALQRAALAKARLSKTLGVAAPALIEEASGDMGRAAENYASAVDQFDTTPLGAAPGRDLADRLIEAPRLAQVIYRAALAHHRAGKKDDGVKYYLLSEQFAIDAPMIGANLARLERGAAPIEAPLTTKSALGRWLLLLSFQYRPADAAGAAADPLGALDGLVIAQMGLRLDPAAEDWRVAIAAELIGRDAVVGAQKLARAVNDDSLYAPEAKLVLARAAVDAKRDGEAAGALDAATRLGAGRPAIMLEAGRILAVIGRYGEARQTLDAVIAGADSSSDRAAGYLARAAANYQAGDLAQSAQDARDAMAAQESDDVRLSAAGYLAAAPDGWYEAVRIGRDLMMRRPRNVDTMNTLGYALIQRDQGLDEGFKILRRAVDIDPDYYPVIDSLGWAYYQFGDFENALKFVGQANELSQASNAEVLDHLGDIYWRVNRQKDARESWKKALTVRPEAFRRVDLEQKLTSGLVKPAPSRRAEPSDENPDRRATPNKI